MERPSSPQTQTIIATMNLERDKDNLVSLFDGGKTKFFDMNDATHANRVLKNYNDQRYANCLGYGSHKKTLVALTDDHILGMVGYNILYRKLLCYDMGNVVSIDWLTVSQQHRKKGYGKKLLEAVEADAIKHKAHALFLFVGNDNQDAQTMFQQCGFSKHNTFGKHVVCEKKLNKSD